MGGGRVEMRTNNFCQGQGAARRGRREGRWKVLIRKEFSELAVFSLL